MTSAPPFFSAASLEFGCCVSVPLATHLLKLLLPLIFAEGAELLTVVLLLLLPLLEELLMAFIPALKLLKFAGFLVFAPLYEVLNRPPF
jgi:hypothetical protein